MEKAASRGSGATLTIVVSVTRARDGPRWRNLRSCSSGASSPCAQTSTEPSGRFRTQPARPASFARRAVVARNPTPCTLPVTLTNIASIASQIIRPPRNGEHGRVAAVGGPVLVSLLRGRWSKVERQFSVVQRRQALRRRRARGTATHTTDPNKVERKLSDRTRGERGRWAPFPFLRLLGGAARRDRRPAEYPGYR